MRKIRSHRVLAIVMMLIMVMTSVSFATDGDSNYTYKAKYMSSWDNSKSGELNYYFLESYFSDSSATYNSHLATASMSLSMAGSSNGDQYIKDALNGLGCTDYASQDYGSSSNDSVGVAIAKKKLANGKILVPVVIRGAGYENEWAQNFKAGTIGDAEGFSAPAKKVEQFVKDQLGSDKDTVIWIMGYSRGGAICNLAAKALSQEYGKDNVYAYCFDSPMAASPADESYDNIHIVKNAYDGIALVLPEYMGFGSNGILNKNLGPSDENAMLSKLKEFSGDYKKFISPNKLKWSKLVINVDLGSSNLMSDVIKLFLGGGDFYTNADGGKAVPTDVWTVLLERLQQAIPSRAVYVEAGYQDGLIAAVRLIRSMTDKQKAAIKDSIGNTSTLLSLVGNKTLVGALASVQDGIDPALSDEDNNKVASAIYKALFDQSVFSASQKADADCALKLLARPLLTMLAADYGSDQQVLGTILGSDTLDILGQCHYLEVNMAWLMTQDSYYNGETPIEDPDDPDDPEPIKIATTKITKLTAAKKAFTVKWIRKKKDINGYQIQYSTSSKFKSGNKTVLITNSQTVSKKISKLKAKKKYYVRIRCYKKIDGKKVYGAWSAKKSVTTKK